MLGTTYPGVEIFVFGGEPFVHPKIEYIIEVFNKYDIPFVVQTNFSKKSVHVMNRIKEPFNINISVHPSEVELDDVLPLFEKVPSNVTINIIDVMYTGREAIKYYMKIKDKGTTVLTPIADFGDGVSNNSLSEYNKMRTNRIYSKIIDFENIKRLGEYRSELWESYNPRGKPCLYNDKYFLYSPNLELHNCCYRDRHEGICKHDKCFLM
jgi:hypothetical protein